MTDAASANENIGRRQALSRLALGGGIVVAGAIAGAGTAAATTRSGGWKRRSLVLDVACLGETWRQSDVNYAADPGDFRGAPFAVEGWIYPDGIIPPGDGFVPARDKSIGRWLCRGNVLIHTQRLEPHVQTTQEFIFGPMTADQLFAKDNISTSGIEGTVETNQTAHRTVIGGTGTYLGVTGEQAQEWTGLNTSIFADDTGNGLNFKMIFDLIQPDV